MEHKIKEHQKPPHEMQPETEMIAELPPQRTLKDFA